MNLGLELVTCALRTGSLKPFIEAGLGHEYVNDQGDPSRLAVFPDQHLAAWRTLLSYQDKHGKAPSVDIFQRSYPADAYELSDEHYDPDELIGIFQEDRRRVLAQLAAGELADFVAQDDINGALKLLEEAARLIRETHQSTSIVVTWDDEDYDLEGRIHREIKRGLLTGIDGFDAQEEFLGFQPGNLICYLGRAKAGKTSFALLSALRAWEDGKRVLFLSFEIAAGRLPSEPGVTDRLDSIGAHINMLDYMQGRLGADHEKKLRDFREYCTDSAFKVVQPTGRYTVADLERDIEKYEPDIVYVDGFYFMTDALTGKPGSNWEGHDNLANDIKKLAMNRLIPIVITHQVREKQLHGKKGAGIDDGAMMGGTAIIMFADLVIGVDADPETQKRTLSCTRSRLHYLQTVFGNWDWSTCTFNECADENPFDQDVFGYQTGGSDDKPPWDQ